ncbi:MAG: tetratricopeptide repeat protein [Myxococcales bacterium]|nr:tetratricopeptide repeat protein [Myxococcales bacterium]
MADRGGDTGLKETMGPSPAAMDLDRTRVTGGSARVLASTAVGSRPEAGATVVTDVLMVGSRVGRYVVLERLGAGAMGVVYSAFDPELDRKVAIKIIKADGAWAMSREARTRMVREAQALAKLSHPSVVAIHDVGVQGEEIWIAMELVEGRTLRAWLGERARGWQEVCAVMLAAGQGLAAAHAAGLVHRDIKPDNVMIGDEGRVRVMDFGLARHDTSEEVAPVLVPREGALLSTDVTTVGSLIGTPGYMAPEQLVGAGAGQAADQFAFCVMFWEGLYGARPFAGETLAELRHSVLAGKVAGTRRRGVPGWLREVLARGLAVNTERRWPTMAGLLAALEGGRARVVRRRWLFAGGAALGLVAALLGAREASARREMARCEAAGAEIHDEWSEQASAAVERAFTATEKTHAATVFARTRPWIDRWAAGWQAARTEACRRRSEGTWDDELYARSEECFALGRGLLGSLLDALTRADAGTLNRATTAAASLPAIEQCLDAVQLRERPDASADPVELRRMHERLARARALQATGDFKRGLEVAQAVVSDARAAGWLATAATGEAVVGSIESSLGRHSEAEQCLLRALAAAREASAPRVALTGLVDLVTVVGVRQTRFAEGKVWAEAAQFLIGVLAGGDRGAEAGLDHALGQLLTAQGEARAAIPVLERALARWTELYGEGHPQVAAALDSLAAAFSASGNLEEAVRRDEQALAIREQAFGADHPVVAESLSTLGTIEDRRGRYEEALALQQRALAIRERVFDADHPDIAESLNRVGAVLTNLRRGDEALAAYERAEGILARSKEGNLPLRATLLYNIALIYSTRRRAPEAMEKHARAIEIFSETLGPEHLKLSYPLNGLATLKSRAGEHDEAVRLMERAIAIREKALGSKDPDLAMSLAALARIERERGRPEAAIGHDERAVKIMEETQGSEHRRLAEPLTGLAESLLAAKRPAEALAPLERALAITEPRPEFAVVVVWQRFLLAQALWGSGGDRTRARVLAERAAADPESQRDPKFVAKVQAWLASHRR